MRNLIYGGLFASASFMGGCGVLMIGRGRWLEANATPGDGYFGPPTIALGVVFVGVAAILLVCTAVAFLEDS